MSLRRSFSARRTPASCTSCWQAASRCVTMSAWPLPAALLPCNLASHRTPARSSWQTIGSLMC